jgi:hypothetical protein
MTLLALPANGETHPRRVLTKKEPTRKVVLTRKVLPCLGTCEEGKKNRTEPSLARKHC